MLGMITDTQIIWLGIFEAANCQSGRFQINGKQLYRVLDQVRGLEPASCKELSNASNRTGLGMDASLVMSPMTLQS